MTLQDHEVMCAMSNVELIQMIKTAVEYNGVHLNVLDSHHEGYDGWECFNKDSSRPF